MPEESMSLMPTCILRLTRNYLACQSKKKKEEIKKEEKKKEEEKLLLTEKKRELCTIGLLFA